MKNVDDAKPLLSLHMYMCKLTDLAMELTIIILLAYFRDVLLPYFNEIYLMPEHPSLKNVNEIWQASKDVEKRYK